MYLTFIAEQLDLESVKLSTSLTQMVLAFFYAFIRGYQSQNMVGGRYLSAFFTSYGVAGMEVTNLLLAVSVGWFSILPMGVGGSFGVIACMYIYRRNVRKDALRGRNHDPINTTANAR